MFIVKYHESHYVTVLDMCDTVIVYLRNTLIAKNSTSIVSKLSLLAKIVPRLLLQAFYFVDKSH